MRTKLAITVALVITAAVSFLGIQSALAKGTPFDAGYSHGCSDANKPESAKYINKPDKGQSFHTEEFMRGYKDGIRACAHQIIAGPSSSSSSSTSSSSKSLYKQGFARGVSNAHTNANVGAVSTTHMNPDDVDCQNDEEPIFDNPEFYSEYQHGYASEANKLAGT
jgi:hypothetical protein